MSWNHRVFLKKIEDTRIYSIKEVYYNDETNKISNYTTEDIAPNGETMQELKQCLERMLEALNEPILNEKVILKDKNSK